MAKNTSSKGNMLIGINMPYKMALDIEKRAKSMQIAKSKYCVVVLKQWLLSGKKLTLEEK